ncbi:MAG: FG-GAP-like repeat-containing protein [Pseudomonadota bacterium]|nr:FG-GAP-like repeat-containing protein [Pseudomonadota bacterium]
MGRKWRLRRRRSSPHRHIRARDFAAGLFVVLLAGCGGGGGGGSSTQQNAASTPATPQQPADALTFAQRTIAAGFDNESRLVGETTDEWQASGVAAVDYDGDGDIDLFEVGTRTNPHSLYENQGDGTFEDIAATVGLDFTHQASGPAFADIDGDGDLDLFIGAIGQDPHYLLENREGTFVDVTTESGLVLTVANTYSATFADYDQDGDLDLFLGHWGSDAQRDTETLWRNRGDGTFESYSIQSGIADTLLGITPGQGIVADTDYSFTPNLSDIDGDGDLDLLMASDFKTSRVYLNNGDGTFTYATDPNVIDEEFGMGAAVGDYDNDGDMDWFVTSIFSTNDNDAFAGTGNRLYNNDGTGTFTDDTMIAGVEDGGWGWGTCFADFNNDGHLDLFLVNGWFDDFFGDDPARLYLANGDGTFNEQATTTGLADRGQGRGVVCFDADRDGDLDLLINNSGENHLAYYRNESTLSNHYLAVKLASASTNHHAIGAWVRVITTDSIQVREIRAGNNFASQNPAEAHFGLGEATQADIEVRWPDGSLSATTGVSADQLITIEQEEFNIRLVVANGQGAGAYEVDEEIPIQAAPAQEGYFFSHWSSDNGGRFADSQAVSTTFNMPGGNVTITANYVPGVAPDAPVGIARRWNEVLLEAIRNDFARPTVHARNLFHVSSAMYDAWSAYTSVETPWLLGRTRAGDACPFDGIATPENQTEAQRKTISYAAYRIIRHRFSNSPGASVIRRDADALMQAFGYDITEEATDFDQGSASALGNYIADCYLRFGFVDGGNEAGDYGNRFYEPVNPPLEPTLPGNPDLLDLDRWQPLRLGEFIDQAGNPAADEPEFLSPEWGQVYPFALTEADRTAYQRDGFDYWVYHDPGMPPTASGSLSDNYRWAFGLVAIWSSHLDPNDGTMIDISPASIGNNDPLPTRFLDHTDFFNTIEGGDPGKGYSINPVTGAPYETQMVPRGDYTRVLAEFWADGPDSETPPGHWFVIANQVNDHPLLQRRFMGSGAELTPLEWEIKTYFVLGGSMHDAAVTAWGIKGWYDYIRPISSLRAMADLGQSSDATLSSYHNDGILLEPGFIELVKADDALAGDNEEHVGKIKFKAWRGPDYITDPVNDVAGVGWILAENWWPYQRPSFVTPPFAGYVSGHSTYSRAAAEVLTALTGDAHFPGGMSSFEIRANEFLVFEKGPSVDMELQWATYQDASDQCSLSRIWGGIHPPSDDLPGRLIGIEIGRDAFERAHSYFNGSPAP